MNSKALAWLMTVQHFEAASGPTRSKAAFDANVTVYSAMTHRERMTAMRVFVIESPWIYVAWHASP